MATARKVVARKPGPRKVEQIEETSPGDLIEVSVTEELRTSGGTRWVKFGVTSTHREEESAEQAAGRVYNYVTDSIAEIVKDLM